VNKTNNNNCVHLLEDIGVDFNNGSWKGKGISRPFMTQPPDISYPTHPQSPSNFLDKLQEVMTSMYQLQICLQRIEGTRYAQPMINQQLFRTQFLPCPPYLRTNPASVLYCTIRVRIVSDIQTLAFGSSLYIRYNTAAHVVNSTYNIHNTVSNIPYVL
jgi:hypothetical protein